MGRKKLLEYIFFPYLILFGIAKKGMMFYTAAIKLSCQKKTTMEEYL